MNFRGFPVFHFNFDQVEEYFELLSQGGKIEYFQTIQNTVQFAHSMGEKPPDIFIEKFHAKFEEFRLDFNRTQEAFSLPVLPENSTVEEARKSLFSIHPLYGFDGERIEAHLRSLKSFEEQSIYLMLVLRFESVAQSLGMTIPRKYKEVVVWACPDLVDSFSLVD